MQTLRPALRTCLHAPAALTTHTVAIGTYHHGLLGAGAAELVKTDITAQGRHDCTGESDSIEIKNCCVSKQFTEKMAPLIAGTAQVLLSCYSGSA